MARNINQVNALRKLIHYGAVSRVARLLEKLHPADVAEVIPDLSPVETKQLMEVLFATRRAGVTFRELPEPFLGKLLGLISDERLALLVSRQPSDDALFFLSLLPPARLEAVSAHLEPGPRELFERLLRYPPGSAGSVMTTKVLSAKQDITAEEALEHIRRQGKDLEAIFYLYVVDDAQILTGVVALRQLILSPGDKPLRELMQRAPISVSVLEDQGTVATLVAKYNFLSLPVTDEKGRLVGVVTVDDVIDVIHEEATEDLYHIAGLEEEDRAFGPVLGSVRKRFVWTMVNLGTAFLASLVIGLFEGSIEKIVALATFMPVVAGLGGNSGTQSLTVVIRGLATGELLPRVAWKAILRQLLVGLLVGIAAGLATGTIVYLWKGDPWLGLVLFLAMLANMAVGALVGAAVPFLLKLVRQDPAMGSGILVTGITDSFGFLTFLGLATLFLLKLAP
ncbi:MAG: magnesium transporter [Myxococcota bacterium]|nr:magnesium transporter [Myxococcota bacterium]